MACTQLGLAQVAPPTILTIDTENQVQYFLDVSDLSKLATDPNITTQHEPANFGMNVTIGDIVAFNGQPAKGTITRNTHSLGLTTAPQPGDAIADTNRQALAGDTFEILQANGTPIGTIMTFGLNAGAPPPGAPSSVTTMNSTILGGTGVFLGVRGQMGQFRATVPVRQASQTEDPSNRRRNGGGKSHFVLHVIPMSLPQIVTTSSGPAVTHSSDFTLVSASKPAVAGETLSLFATGLGPTVPGVDPGKPFPSSPLAAVNSPVQVTVNGNQAQVLAAVGFPGAVDAYQVNFQVPPGTTKGPATVQVTAAWIVGPAATIAVQ